MPNPAIGIAGASLGSSAMQASAAKKAARAQERSADKATALQREIYEDTSAKLDPFYKGGMPAWGAFLYEMGLGPAPTIGGAELPGITEEQYQISPARRIGEPERGGGGMRTIPAEMGTRFNVGGQQFDTRDAAQGYVDSLDVDGGTLYSGYTQSPMAQYLLEEGTDDITAAFGGINSGAALEALEENRRRVITADTDKYFDRLLGTAGMSFDAANQQGAAGRFYATQAGNNTMAAGRAQAQGYLGAADAWNTGIGDAAGAYGYFNRPNNPLSAYGTSIWQNSGSLAPTTSLRPVMRG